MTVAVEVRRRFGQIVVPVLGIGALFYLGYHFFEGERGLKASWSVDQRLVQAKAERDKLRAEREKLGARVAMLREATIDRDMLDERLRRMLNLVEPNDIVILYTKPLEPDLKPAGR
ncbi:MAG: septum formation initiator family protein [Rhodospirillaceae bacterium]|nr:septum formation initiator family protein [Rhodospirillaceae bacterium]